MAARKSYPTRLLEDRLAKEPTPAKKLELEFAAVLFNTGISHGEALRIAETIVVRVGPAALAERLHKISNEFLMSQASS